MPTKPVVDEALLNRALTLGGLPTKHETINAALREPVQRRERLRLVKLFGTVEYDWRYDDKKERRSR